jgi:hypothetical protein
MRVHRTGDRAATAIPDAAAGEVAAAMLAL